MPQPLNEITVLHGPSEDPASAVNMSPVLDTEILPLYLLIRCPTIVMHSGASSYMLSYDALKGPCMAIGHNKN